MSLAKAAAVSDDTHQFWHRCDQLIASLEASDQDVPVEPAAAVKEVVASVTAALADTSAAVKAATVSAATAGTAAAVKAAAAPTAAAAVKAAARKLFFVTCDDRVAGAPARLVRSWRKGAEREW